MFHYALQLAMEKKGYKTAADLSLYEQFREHNGFELEEVFGIHPDMADPALLSRISPGMLRIPVWYTLLPEGIREDLRRRHQSRVRAQRLKKPEVIGALVQQPEHNSYMPEIFDLPRGELRYLDGLWQDFRYFDWCAEDIRRAFQFSEAVRSFVPEAEKRRLLEGLSAGNAVSVHVRRGDFVGSKFDVCTPDYYRLAMDALGVGPDTARFYFFTDDAAYIQSAFSWVKNRTVISHGPKGGGADLWLLTKSRRIIISNSTFSFWERIWRIFRQEVWRRRRFLS